MSSQADSQAGLKGGSKVQAVGFASPVFQMLGAVDGPEGAVCGIDGVCDVPAVGVAPVAAPAGSAAENRAQDSSSTAVRSK
ncbi:hypothetical protein [Subtercola lobariae]|uniref:Uncharacterized protein n=1 Tax=Subtercola lobariae TaxID=1588641 RepID=A0A917B608_9MICO|nr:hypothetical protein [Subtercola lobariae]GGF24642.1 hypothetical protein GCM10011399_17690 [Subtercola lobariae]